MQLIKQIIEKKMSLYEEFMLKRNYLRAFSHLYSCFNFALAILDEELNKDKERKIRKLWKRLLTNENKKDLAKLQKYAEQDIKLIIKCQKTIDTNIDSSDDYKSKLGEKGAIMVIGYAYPPK